MTEIKRGQETPLASSIGDTRTGIEGMWVTVSNG